MPYIVTTRPIIPTDNDSLEPISRIGENVTHTSNPNLNDTAIQILSTSIHENIEVIPQAESTIHASTEEIIIEPETTIRRNEEEDLPELNFIEDTDFSRISTHGRKLLLTASKIVNDERTTICRSIEWPKDTRGVLNPTSTFGQALLELIRSCEWVDNNCLLKDKICSPKCKCMPKIAEPPLACPSITMPISDSCDYNGMISIVSEHCNENKHEDDEYGDQEFEIFDGIGPFLLNGSEMFEIDA